MRKLKLFHKFLLFVLPCLMISIIITSSILSWTNSRFFDRNISSNYRDIIKASAGEILLYMENALKNLEGLSAALSATQADLFRQEMALIGFRESAPHYDCISLISPDGERRATTELIENDAVDLPANETFQKAVSGQSAISSVMLTRQNIPYVHIAVPIRQRREVSAVLWAKLNVKSVWDVLEGIRIGETGQVYLMDSSGQAIGHREMDKVAGAVPMVSREVLKNLLESGGLPVEWGDKTNGRKSYCLGSVIPKLNWIIVLTQDDREAHSYLYQNIKWAILLTALICLFAVLIGWRALRRILRPVHNLHRQVQRIGQGDLDQTVPVESQDEIGDLSAAFNKMTESLKTFIREEIERAKELAHARNLAVLGTASGKVTHEVGNLLNNIEIILYKLKREPLSPVLEESIHTLEVETGRISHFIENFLLFAKKPYLRLQKINPEIVIQEVVVVFASEAERRGIRIELDLPSDLPPIPLDTSLIYQVLNNLIKNSLENSSDPSLILIEERIEGDFLRMTVKDDGPGIEAPVLERIFEPFFSTKTNKGTGVGLAICKTIVEAHRGSIECESNPGEYTAFILRLPLQ